jgi:Helix-turn-helix
MIQARLNSSLIASAGTTRADCAGATEGSTDGRHRDPDSRFGAPGWINRLLIRCSLEDDSASTESRNEREEIARGVWAHSGVLAKRAKLHRVYVAQIEGETKTPSLAALERLAKALDVPVTALLE